MSFLLECGCCNRHLEFLITPTVEEILLYGFYTWNGNPGEPDFCVTCPKCTDETMNDLKQDSVFGCLTANSAHGYAEMLGRFHQNDDEKQVKHINDRFFTVE